MRPVSPEFLTTVRSSHTMTARARVCPRGQTGVDPDGTEIPIIDGDVQLDAGADIRATVDLTTQAPWPARASDLLAPYGNELFIERGITVADGATEWVPFGYFRIDTIEQDTAPEGTIRISGSDRMSGLVDGRLLHPIQFQTDDRVGQIMYRLVRDIYPDVHIEWDDSTYDYRFGRDNVAERKRWDFLDTLVTSVGKRWFWDHRGVLRIENPPDPGTAVYTVNEGDGGVLVSASRNMGRDGVYNAVVAEGQGGDDKEPVRAIARDMNSRSPTFWEGDFGKVPRFYSSPMITTWVQASTTARNLLRRSIGIPYSVDFDTVPNPALEPLDPIIVEYPGVSELHIVETLSIPLTAAGDMTATTREQTRVSVFTTEG